MHGQNRHDLGPAAETLCQLLDARAVNGRGKYVFLPDGRAVKASLSFPQLARQARSVASMLRDCSSIGARAILFYPPGSGFLPAFFGCLYAGVVAVPVPPLDAARMRRSLPRLQAIIEDAEPQLLLTTGEIPQGVAERLLRFDPKLRVIDTGLAVPDDLQEAAGAAHSAPCAHNVAYLQYTSGSTSRPRGVIVQHGNVLHNLECLRRAFLYDAESVAVTWMPHFHDYGLIEGLLQPLYSDIPVYVLSPLTILKRPVRWLEAISRNRATHSHAPNFAYELCIQRAPAEGLDLASWRMAGTGAETVRADTLARFARAFGPAGFSADAFFPAYGLAEATLFVTARRPDACYKVLSLDAAALERHHVMPVAEGPNWRTVVSCGIGQGESCLRIVDPVTRQPCASDRVGEIWLSDPSVALGYHGRPTDNAATFAARLAGDQIGNRFLRTGDLGFLHDGELYVTGRLKDLIIVAGANHYPEDIEWTVQSHCPELRRDHCAAFGVDHEDTEQLVIIAEAERQDSDWADLFRRMRAAIVSEHEFTPSVIEIVARGAIPKTSSGKLQRSACKKAFLDGRLPVIATWRSRSRRPSTIQVNVADASDLRRWLCGELGEMLGIDAAEINPDTPFTDLGLDSRSSLALIATLEERLGRGELSPTLLWEHPSVTALCRHLTDEQALASYGQAATAAPAASIREPIAIIGLGCRFPGGPSVEAYWDLLRAGHSAIGASERMPGAVAGFVATPEAFDAAFFGLSAMEAAAMDPRQRLLLEVAWEALEHAALAPERLRGRPVGVFIGASSEDFAFRLFQQPNAFDLIGAHTGTGFASSVAANRLSYTLDLRGPSLTIDTACSSSLVAVHQACQSLRSDECELALAGGVNLLLSQEVQYALACAGMLSPSGRCQTFDAEADGYVRGEGCGLVILKRLSDAQRDGDNPLALIRASAINQDGRSNGLTAPNPQAQAAVIRAALAQADVPAATIDYVEAHGTGTRLGDPIEMGALQAALAEGRGLNDRCWIGSVKTNIGHLEAAAGIAGLIKTVLALGHGEIPPHLNLHRLNPLIRIAETPLAIPTALEPWPQPLTQRPRRAAVSSFGFGGTNAHVILEQAVDQPQMQPPVATEPHIFTISAMSESALRELAARHADRIKAKPPGSLGDLCFTVVAGRAHLPRRIAVPVADTEALVAQLQAFAAGREAGYAGAAPAQRPDIAFLFSGQGAQYPGMARQLYASEPLFRSVLDECAALTRGRLAEPLLPVIFGDRSGLLDQTAYTQPALFVVEYGLARLWQQWGIEPSAVLGHSIGEYVAACVANVFAMPVALELVVARGLLMDQLPQSGRMLAVGADEGDVAETIERYAGKVVIAAVNAPRNIVLSGEGRAVVELQQQFTDAGLPNHLLPVSHAFHSPLMEPVLGEFEKLASTLTYSKPRLRLISNLDGQPLSAAPDARYWTRQLRSTVQFASGVNWLGRTHRIFLEIGPQPILSALAARCLTEPGTLCLPSLRRGHDDRTVLMDSLARLHVAGVTPDWRRVHGNAPRRRLHGLPTYPFERESFPLPSLAPGRAAEPFGAARQALPVDSPSAGASAPHSYRLDWSPTSHPPSALSDSDGAWLVLADDDGWGEAIAASLERSGRRCRVLYQPRPNRSHRATSFDDKHALRRLLDEVGPLQGIAYLWALNGPPPVSLVAKLLPEIQRRQLAPVLGLTRVLAQAPHAPRLWLLTQAAQAAVPTDDVNGLVQTPLWGIGRTMALELPAILGGMIDLPAGSPQPADIGMVAAVLLGARLETQYAIRNGRLHAPRLRTCALPQACAPVVRSDASYLVTGGLGSLGRGFARWLVGEGAHEVWLLGRRGARDPAAGADLAALEKTATIRTAAVDLADAGKLARQLSHWGSQGLPLRGVIQAAGLNGRSPLGVLDWPRTADLLAAKVQGTWAISDALGECELDFFIACSSVAALWGGQQLAAYSAANAFLDGFAHYRKAHRKPALSIALGPIANSAMLNDDAAAELGRIGLRAIPFPCLTAELPRLVASDVPHLAFVDADFELFAGLYAARCPTGLFTDVGNGTARASDRASPSPADPQEPLSPEAVKLWLAAQVRTALRLPHQQLDGDVPLPQLGIDSLIAMELRNRIQQRLGLMVPLPDLLGHLGLNALAERLTGACAANTQPSTNGASRAWIEGEI